MIPLSIDHSNGCGGSVSLVTPLVQVALFSLLLLGAKGNDARGRDVLEGTGGGSCVADTLRPALHQGIIAKMLHDTPDEIPLDQVLTAPAESLSVVTDSPTCVAGSNAMSIASGYPVATAVIVIKIGDRGFAVYDVVRDDDIHYFFDGGWTFLGALAGI